LIEIINLFFTALMTIVSNYSLHKIDAVKKHIVKIGLASNKQMGADKMRDAINRDVLNSFKLAQSEASKKLKLKKEFAKHLNEIKSNIEAIKLSHVSPKVDENIQFISNALNEYLGSYS
jgi:hypothetical protein